MKLMIFAVMMTQAMFSMPASADCVSAYEQSVTKYHKVAAAIAATGTAVSLATMPAGPVPFITFGTTLLTSSSAMARAEDNQNTVDLLNEAKVGAGTKLNSGALTYNTTAEKVAEITRSLNDINTFCQNGRLLTYHQVCKIIGKNIEAMK